MDHNEEGYWIKGCYYSLSRQGEKDAVTRWLATAQDRSNIRMDWLEEFYWFCQEPEGDLAGIYLNLDYALDTPVFV